MGPEQLRVIFLVALFIVLIVLAVRFFTSGTFSWLVATLLDILLLGAFLLTGITFFLLLFRIDPMPYIRQGAYWLSFQQNVRKEYMSLLEMTEKFYPIDCSIDQNNIQTPEQISSQIVNLLVEKNIIES